jgi:hypothetical protein
MHQRRHRADRELPFEPEPDIDRIAASDAATAMIAVMINSPDTFGPTLSTEGKVMAG